jgi:hypothetical protein
MAQMLQKLLTKETKNEGVISGILNKEWFSNFMLVYNRTMWYNFSMVYLFKEEKMKKTIITICAFVMLFGFAVSGAMAEVTWSWGEPITITATPKIVDIEGYPLYSEIYGSSNGTSFSPLSPDLGNTLPSILQFLAPAIDSVLKSVFDPGGVEYGIDADAVGVWNGTSYDALLIEQPYVPYNTEASFKSIAAGTDGTLYVLYEKGDLSEQYLLVGTPSILWTVVTVRFTPRSLNLGSQGNWVTCKISDLPSGYRSSDIDLSADRLCIVAINDIYLDEADRICHDTEGPSGLGKKLMVKFSRGDLITLISNNPGSDPNSAKITLAGYSKDEKLQFYGDDTIKTKLPKKPKKK